MDIFYGSDSIVTVKPTGFVALLHLNSSWLRMHYQWLVFGIVFLSALNITGIGRNAVSLLLFIAVKILSDLNDKVSNGGDRMALLLLFYLAFANTYSYYTLQKRKPFSERNEKLYNLISNLAAWSLIINLCMVYFFAGFFKALDPYWQDGTTLHYFFNDDRYSVFIAPGGYIALPTVFLYIINYGTILLELAFPFLIWHKKFRNRVLFLCFLMHLGIYSFLMVYAMSVIYVLQYGLFYSNDEMLALAAKIRGMFKKLISFAGR